jgi:autotransporter-associated beta strand protein
VGTVAVNGPASTNVTFTPSNNWNGTAYFAYRVSDSGGLSDTGRVTVTVNPVNDAPVAVDDTAATDEDVAVVINVLTNDTDVDSAVLTVSWVQGTATNASGGAMGTVVTNASGTNVTFTPAPNSNGVAYFSYTVSDGALAATGRVTVTIAPVHDPWEPYYWIGVATGTGAWNQATNWDAGVFPDATDAVVRIERDITGSGLTVNLNTEASLNNLYLADTNGTTRITIAPGSGGSLRVHGTNAMFDTIPGNFQATISAPITLETDLTIDGKYTFTAPIGDDGNSRRIVKTDAGDITLSATNTYGGETLIRQGVVTLGTNEAIPDTSVVNLSNTTTTAYFSLSGFSDTIAGLRSTGGQKHKVQNTSAANASTLTIAVAAGQTHAYTVTPADAGILNGGAAPLSLVKDGPGTQILSGTKSYTGSTTVRAGTLDFGANNAVTSSVIVLEGGTLKVDGAAYAMRAGQTNRWVLNPAGAGTTGLLKAGSLDITAGIVDFAALGPLGSQTFILAEYTNLTGAAFATVLNLPGGCVIDYTYQGNKIALHGNVGTVFTIR